MAEEVALDLLLSRSVPESGVCTPDKIDRAEFRVWRLGLRTCDAPFLYERCIFSLDGEGGRRECWFSSALEFCTGSGEADTVDGDLFLVSIRESAWKNLLSGWLLPTEDIGGEGTFGEREVSS